MADYPREVGCKGAAMTRSWKGLWWRPEAPDNLQAGELIEQPNGGSLLSLIGGFDLSIKTPIPGGGVTIEEGTEQIPMLLGRSGSTYITLVDVRLRSSRGGSFWTPDEQILAPVTALVGVALDEVDDAIFHTEHLRQENLLPWLNLGGLQLSGTIGGSTSTATVTRTEALTAQEDGWTITACTMSGGFHVAHLQDATSLTADVRAFLSIRSPAPLPYNGFSEVSHAITDLLTLAGAGPSGLLSRSLDSPLPPTAPSVRGGIANDANAEVLASRIFQAHPADPVTSRYLFTCADLPFNILIERWLPLRRQIADAANILFGTLYGPPTYTEMRLLSMGIAAETLHHALFPEQLGMPTERFKALECAALEGLAKPDRAWLHPRLRNEPTYVERVLQLTELPDQTAIDLLMPDRTAWAKQLRDARNGMAHRARPSVSYNTLFELAEVSRYLLYLVLMQQLGLPGEVQQRALQQNQYLSHLRH